MPRYKYRFPVDTIKVDSRSYHSKERTQSQEF